jgi:vacuolar-type H+-ATPase subunit D/Vma8
MTDLDELFDQLKQKRDEVRVQIHLASKEVQDEWHDLEKKMEDFSNKAKLAESSTGVGQALSELGGELKKGYKRIRAAIKDD